MKLRNIKLVYSALNKSNFNGALTMPIVLIKRWRNAYAQHVVAKKNRLEFNLSELDYLTSRDVIFHEMIHQYIEEILDIQEDDHHGPIFWAVYKWFAIDSDIRLHEVIE